MIPIHPRSKLRGILGRCGMNKVYIIGIGSGTEDYLLPIARREIETSDCLIGGRRALRLFQDLHKEEVLLEGNFEKVIPFLLKEREKKKIAVLVSGDPGLYSFLGQISRVLKREEYVVIPGISALQIAFAKIGEAWEDATVISLHGRKMEDLAMRVKGASKIFLFTDSSFPPGKIAAHLLEKGVENRRAIVMENLTYPNERILDADLNPIAGMEGFGLCVMIIKKERE
ncbi:MAG: precorrin-6y C5,15-methyltransferase (decarboxylating) subunit CbiE [Deltaproteobacteria bacterium]|nr:precorrin-6y C5,15-methyltransferase (decarboxylating) subunit CbiE [Deltaproteobacteria bacterium]